MNSLEDLFESCKAISCCSFGIKDKREGGSSMETLTNHVPNTQHLCLWVQTLSRSLNLCSCFPLTLIAAYILVLPSSCPLSRWRSCGIHIHNRQRYILKTTESIRCPR